jgi:hypothetical protein
MKKTTFLLIASLLMLASCSKDDSPVIITKKDTVFVIEKKDTVIPAKPIDSTKIAPVFNPEPLYGTWQIDTFNIYRCDNDKFRVTYITFNRDMTYTCWDIKTKTVNIGWSLAGTNGTFKTYMNFIELYNTFPGAGSRYLYVRKFTNTHLSFTIRSGRNNTNGTSSAKCHKLTDSEAATVTNAYNNIPK